MNNKMKLQMGVLGLATLITIPTVACTQHNQTQTGKECQIQTNQTTTSLTPVQTTSDGMCVTYSGELIPVRKGELKPGAKSYSFDTFNLAMYDCIKVEFEPTLSKTGEPKVRITYDNDIESDKAKAFSVVPVDTLYRYIRSFDTIDTMMMYNKIHGIEFDDDTLVFLIRNWAEDIYYILPEGNLEEPQDTETEDNLEEPLETEVSKNE